MDKIRLQMEGDMPPADAFEAPPAEEGFAPAPAGKAD
jgi:hypothetical protein